MTKNAKFFARSLIAVGTLSLSTVSHSQDTVLQRLDGQWQGNRLFLHIDTARHQGNTEPDKPFTREPLRIKNISGSVVVFSIGSRTFIATVGEGSLSITQPGMLGAEKLFPVHAETQPGSGQRSVKP